MSKFVITAAGFAALLRGETVQLQASAADPFEIRLDEEIIGLLQDFTRRPAHGQEATTQETEDIDDPHREAVRRDIQERQIKAAAGQASQAAHFCETNCQDGCKGDDPENCPAAIEAERCREICKAYEGSGITAPSINYTTLASEAITADQAETSRQAARDEARRDTTPPIGVSGFRPSAEDFDRIIEKAEATRQAKDTGQDPGGQAGPQ